jgi:hypothetical protein
MTNLQQVKQVAAQLHLNLDNPKSVRKQLQRVNQAQEKLRQFRQEVNTQIQAIPLDYIFLDNIVLLEKLPDKAIKLNVRR